MRIGQIEGIAIVCYIPPMTKLLVATNNAGKKREYDRLLALRHLQLCSPQDLQLSVTVRESGATYAENARIKALSYLRASGLPALADDSGLEVDALGGEPGLRSARYAGPGSGDADRYRLLLQRLEGVPWEQRTARFRCVVVLAVPGGEIHTTEGSCEGIIAFEPRGNHGFGYDPVFYLPQYGQTMAQLPPKVKNRISHRAVAVQGMLPILSRILVEPDAMGEGD
jgi:XTP/dITP diphosphohydrolase